MDFRYPVQRCPGHKRVEPRAGQIQRERPKVDRVDRDAWDVTRGCTRLTADTMKACAPILPLRQALETARRRDRLDEDIRKAIAAGAQAYLVKGMSHLKLLEAIRSVRAGEQYFPRSIRNSVPGNLNRSALSPRELEILRLIVKGLNNQEIAEALNITRGTVKWHVNIILRRLDVNDRTQAVVIAAQRGIVEI